MAFADRLEKVYARRLSHSSSKEAEGYTGREVSEITEWDFEPRFFGIAKYALHGDVFAFRSNLSEFATQAVTLFRRHIAGKPTDDSFLSMLAYKQVYDALAAGDFNTAKILSELIGGRDTIEERFDSSFIRSIGYMTKATVLDDKALFDRWYPGYEVECEDEYYAFEGLANLLRSILDRDLEMATAAIQNVAKEHQLLCKDKKWFYDTEDELVSVLGIGAANLARHRGLDVPAIPPFIPADLLIEVNKYDEPT